LRVLILKIIAWLIPKDKKDKKIRCLRIYQGNLSIVQEKDVMFTFYDDGSYFDHLYAVGFPAGQDRIIEYNKSHTFIDIGKRLNFLKKLGFRLSFGVANLFVFLWKTVGLWKLVKKEISVIRGSDPHHTGLAAMILSFITNVPYCISIHSNYDLIFPEEDFFYLTMLPIKARYLRKLFERFIFSRAKFILSVSQFIADYALRNGARKNAVKIIPHGVDVCLFDKADNHQMVEMLKREGKPLIIVVSRISREKNIFDVVDIALKLKSILPSFLFVIVGDGPDRKIFEEKIKKLDLGENIKLLGFQNQTTVAALRKLANVNLCLLDGFSLIEAALSSRPIVAYDVEWHPELIKDNQTGILVPNRDVQSAAASIKRLINDVPLASFLAENARRLAINRNSSEIAIKTKIKVFDEIIRG
jgi:glycosyltransferase involved in cell wall biosynthesis